MVEAVRIPPGLARPESVSGSAWTRARHHLARRRSFRLAALGLCVLISLSILAPFLASDRPLYLEAVHKSEYERARRTLVPVAEALAALLVRSEPEFLAARPSESEQTLEQARRAEARALETRLDTLATFLPPEPADEVHALARAVDSLLSQVEAGRGAEAAEAARALPERVRALRTRLDPAGLELRPARSSPLLAGLTPLDAGLALGWTLALAGLALRRWLGVRRVLLASLLAALAAGGWSAWNGGGSPFHTADFKARLTQGEIEARRVFFAPVPYGFAEQHPEESLRPPTWLAAAEMDAAGAYVRGPRAPQADRMTGFVPETRPVEVRAGEPALNSPWRHVLGTDATGRDLLARVIHGGRVSLMVGCLATALMMTIGIAVGALAGYFGGALDLVLSRVIEVVVSFPLLSLVLVSVAFLGPSLWNVVLVLGCVGWTGVARLCRTEFQRERELEYVAAARSLGFAWPRIVVRHILPNTLAPLLVAATFSVAGSILVEAALSFLGYGVRVPIPSWGALTSESRELSNWWMQLFPGTFLFATVLCVQLVSDALRDALDPRRGGPR